MSSGPWMRRKVNLNIEGRDGGAFHGKKEEKMEKR